MAKRKYTSEEIIHKLREADVRLRQLRERGCDRPAPRFSTAATSGPQLKMPPSPVVGHTPRRTPIG
jgi:hypothetical protein